MKVTVVGTEPALKLSLRLKNIGAEIAHQAEPILQKSVEASIFRRAYRTGRLLRSAETDSVIEPRRIRLRAFSTLFYGGYVERGTSRMVARMPFKLGVESAKPVLIANIRKLLNDAK